jgi:hypothetical protein
MTHGQEGDWTWRYLLWQWFRQNNVAMQFVGPYKGTVAPPEPMAPQPPPLYGSTEPTTMASTTGGYAAGVDAGFLSNSNHFAVWGRAAATDKGLIGDILDQYQADMMLIMLGFNDMGWFYSNAEGTIDSIGAIVDNARAKNPNINSPSPTYRTAASLVDDRISSNRQSSTTTCCRMLLRPGSAHSLQFI